MSLINIHNFAAPLTNKVHLITILMVTITFTVLRASGGQVDIRNRPLVPKEKTPPRVETETGTLGSSLNKIMDQKKAPAHPVEQPAGHSRPVAPEQGKGVPEQNKRLAEPSKRIDYLSDVLGGSAAGEATGQKDMPPAKPVKKNQDTGAGGGLDDIEKTLGLK